MNLVKVSKSRYVDLSEIIGLRNTSELERDNNGKPVWAHYTQVTLKNGDKFKLDGKVDEVYTHLKKLSCKVGDVL